VRPEELGKFKNSPRRVSKRRPSGLTRPIGSRRRNCTQSHLTSPHLTSPHLTELNLIIFEANPEYLLRNKNLQQRDGDLFGVYTEADTFSWALDDRLLLTWTVLKWICGPGIWIEEFNHKQMANGRWWKPPAAVAPVGIRTHSHVHRNNCDAWICLLLSARKYRNAKRTLCLFCCTWFSLSHKFESHAKTKNIASGLHGVVCEINFAVKTSPFNKPEVHFDVLQSPPAPPYV
jgi:hypothetical protein